MQKIDGYVKRLKSLSLVVTATAILSYNVADSDRRLEADFTTVQSLFLASSLLSAYVPRTARITRVDERRLRDWLAEAERASPIGVVPINGALLDVIRLWNVPASRVEGFIALPNGEMLSFTRHSAMESAAGQTERCMRAAGECYSYTLFLASVGLAERLTVVREANGSGAATFEESGWRYLTPDDHMPVTLEQINTTIIARASDWTAAPGDADAAYYSLRQVLSERTVRIPIVDVDVDASSAALFLTVFALIAAALIAHSLIVVRAAGVLDVAEPWIIMVPVRGRDLWSAKLQAVLSWSGGIVLILSLILPTGIVALSISMTPSPMIFVLGLPLFLTLALAIASAVALISILRSIHRHEVR